MKWCGSDRLFHESPVWRNIMVGLLAVVLSLGVMLLQPGQAESCGWWGDGEGDDDDVIVVGDDGEPVPEDDDSAEDPAELTRMGNRYRRGEGVAQNPEEALRLYRKAADRGFAGAQNNLAVMYEEGEGVPRDEAEAARWYRMAAEQGNGYARHSLGRMYMEGRGVSQDYARAAHWIRLSADQGHRGAFGDMGTLYWKGWGVEKNDVMAYLWFKRAALHGDEESARLLGVVSAAMTPASIAEAERLVQEWMPGQKRAPR
jgi:TPR repeat protein